jgi:hypothetical protein
MGVGSDVVDVLRTTADGGKGFAQRVGQLTSRAGRFGGRSLNLGTNALTDMRGAARNADDFAASTEGAMNTADEIAANTRDVRPVNEEKNLTDVAKAQSRMSKVTDLMKNNPKTTLAGISVVTIAALAGAYLDSTDGVTVNITKIEIVDSTHIKVSYTAPNAFFHPGINDTFDFVSSTPTTPNLNGTNGHKVTAKNGQTDVTLEAQISSVQSNPGSWGSMKCNSSFSNQFGTTTGDGVDWIVSNVANPLLHAGDAAFCTIFPTLCDKTTWIIVCVICLIILFIIIGLPLLK